MASGRFRLGTGDKFFVKPWNCLRREEEESPSLEKFERHRHGTWDIVGGGIGDGGLMDSLLF